MVEQLHKNEEVKPGGWWLLEELVMIRIDVELSEGVGKVGLEGGGEDRGCVDH